jgi:magnesium transporter
VLRILYRRGDGSIDSTFGAEGIPGALADPSGLLWVDFLDETDASCERVLLDVFRFHPLAVDDALRESHVPKVDDWESYLYIVLHALAFDPKADEQLTTMELDVFAGPNYIVTHREQPCLTG